MDVSFGVDRQFVNTEAGPVNAGYQRFDLTGYSKLHDVAAFLHAKRGHRQLDQVFSANFNQRFCLVIGRTQFEIHRTVESHTQIHRNRRFEERQQELGLHFTANRNVVFNLQFESAHATGQSKERETSVAFVEALHGSVLLLHLFEDGRGIACDVQPLSVQLCTQAVASDQAVTGDLSGKDAGDVRRQIDREVAHDNANPFRIECASPDVR